MRDLTANERAVLAFKVEDPDAWWAHVNNQNGQGGKNPIDHEAALKAKVAKWQSDYDAAPVELKTRGQKDAAEEEEIQRQKDAR